MEMQTLFLKTLLLRYLTNNNLLTLNPICRHSVDEAQIMLDPVELMDMRDAQRSYEANLTMVEGTRRMLERTLDLLRR